MNPKHMAQAVAQQGRNGDDTLVHVSRDELRGLAALHPLGRLSRNPDTGLPEAFDLGDILGIVGSVAGLALAPFTGGASLALDAAIGGGLGTFGGDLLGGKSFGDSLQGGLMSGLLGYGLGSAGSLLGGGADAASKEALDTAMASGQISPVSSLSQMATPAAAGGAGDYSFADLSGAGGGLGSQGVMGLNQAALTDPTIMQQAAQLPGGAAPGFQGGNLAGAPNTYWDTLTDRAKLAAQQGKNALTGLSDPSKLWNTFGTNAMSTTIPIGLSLYGSSLPGQNTTTAPQMTHQYPTLPGPNQRRYTPPPPNYDTTTGREWDYFSPAFAEGGEVMGLRDSNMGARRLTLTPEERRASYDANYAARQMALHPRREYNGVLGTPANNEVSDVKFAGGGSVSGPGGGLDDAIPAVIQGRNGGRQPAALSDGEYVVPSHAVSALGNGSTEEGSRQLDGMVSNVMQAKYGTTNRKPNPINPKAALSGLGGARRFAEGGDVQMAMTGDRIDMDGTTYESRGTWGDGSSEYRDWLQTPEAEQQYLKYKELPWDDTPEQAIARQQFIRDNPTEFLKMYHPDPSRRPIDKKGYEQLERWRKLKSGFPTS